MGRIAITGHMNLTSPTAALVDEAIRGHLAAVPRDELVGVSCIAAGADSIFAAAVLDLRGQLETIIPSTNYRQTKVDPDHEPVFDDLLRRAANVISCPSSVPTATPTTPPTRHSSIPVTSSSLSGTAKPQPTKAAPPQVVTTAKDRNIPVTVIWPDGAQRSPG